MTRVVVLVLISITLGLAALLLIRSALSDVGGFALEVGSAGRQLGRLAGTWKFWLGGVLLFGVLLISLELYGNEQLSQVVPLYSISYVAIALIGKYFLDEQVTTTRWIGIAAIIVGVSLVARS